ncbi:MAG TPA: hypothetical protein VGP82_24905 [Ktedonobacterales bacterium]|jgi:hypothetical protein|nr:hypothetical protein [Ktedonobacterales bacterium]
MEEDTRKPQRQRDGETLLTQSARQAAETSNESRRERIEEGVEPTDEKGNILPPQREESGMGGPADENWRAGQIAEQPGPYPAEE